MRVGFLPFLICATSAQLVSLVLMSGTGVDMQFVLPTMDSPDVIKMLNTHTCPDIALILEYTGQDSIVTNPALHAFVNANVNAVTNAVLLPFVAGSGVPNLVASHISTKCSFPVYDSISQSERNSIVHVSLNNDNLDSLQAKIDALKAEYNVDLYYVATQPAAASVEKRQYKKLNLTSPFERKALFERYVFMNNAVLSGLVVMSVLVAIIYFAISEVSGIQAPTRFEPKHRS